MQVNLETFCSLWTFILYISSALVFLAWEEDYSTLFFQV